MALRKDFAVGDKYYYARIDGFQMDKRGNQIHLQVGVYVYGFEKSSTLTTPPADPTIGDIYLLPESGCTGDWENMEGTQAVWSGSEWAFEQYSIDRIAPETTQGYQILDISSYPNFQFDTLSAVDKNYINQSYQWLKDNIESFNGWTDV